MPLAKSEAECSLAAAMGSNSTSAGSRHLVRWTVRPAMRWTACAAGLVGLLLSATLFAATGAPEQPTPSFDPAPWLSDYAQLTAALEESYSNMAWKASLEGGANLPSLSQAATAALHSAASDADASKAIRTFVAGFHDGHLSELPRFQSSGSNPADEPPAFVLDRNDPATGCAALGYGSSVSVAFSLPFETLPGFKLLNDGLESPFRTGTITRTGVPLVGILRIQNFRARAFPAVCLQAWNDMLLKNSAVTMSSVKDAARERWFIDLASRLRDLQVAGVEVLIIDIGNNGGGDDSGDWAARLFSSATVQSARMLMVDAPVSAGYFDEEISDLTRGIEEARTEALKDPLRQARDRFVMLKENIGRARCDMSWVWHERRAWGDIPCSRMLDAGYASGPSPGLPAGAFGDAKVASLLSWASTEQQHFGAWTRPSFVLTDSRTYSSAEMFAAVMKDNGIATIIGTTTGGDGCGFMVDAPPLVLTNSKLRFRIPNCMRLRADGTNEELGITPDIALAPMESESARARAERAVHAVVGDH